MPRKPTVISLFSGAGGLDYGLESAGFDTAVAVEFEHNCCETLRANRRWPVIERSVFDVTTDEILKSGSLAPGEADLLVGGPPCQPFSKSGYWVSGDSRRLSDPRSDTLAAYLRILEETQPRTFLLENVYGIAYSGKNEGLSLLLARVDEINERTGSNYRPEYRVLQAADFGVPQLRERFFIIASRDGTSFKFPSPTHGTHSRGDQLPLIPLPRYRTAWDALADVGPDLGEDLEVRGKWAKLLPSIPEGKNYLWHTERGGGLALFGWRRRYWNFLLKLAKTLPSWTIQAQPGPAVGPFHWENRRLSTRELCRLQTFPDDVVIQGGRTSIQRQVGNAVPSLLAEVLGREIRRQLLGRTNRGAPRLLPKDQVPVPAPHDVAEVPRAFHQYVGTHEGHPGTGLGHRALTRSPSP